jgi:hypothetical protein
MYCTKPIDTSDAGWGYMQDFMERTYYHVECLNMCEGINVG